jgi:hypothetical protein
VRGRPWCPGTLQVAEAGADDWAPEVVGTLFSPCLRAVCAGRSQWLSSVARFCGTSRGSRAAGGWAGQRIRGRGEGGDSAAHPHRGVGDRHVGHSIKVSERSAGCGCPGAGAELRADRVDAPRVGAVLSAVVEDPIIRPSDHREKLPRRPRQGCPPSDFLDAVAGCDVFEGRAARAASPRCV